MVADLVCTLAGIAGTGGIDDGEVVNDIVRFDCPFDAKGDAEEGNVVSDIVLPD